MLAPLGALSLDRLRELAEVAVVERAARGSDPLAAHKDAAHSVFLLRGEILLMYAGGGTLVVVGGMGDGRHPLNRRKPAIARSRAISDLDLTCTMACSRGFPPRASSSCSSALSGSL